MWENLQKEKRRSCTAGTVNTPAPNAKTKKTDKQIDDSLAVCQGIKKASLEEHPQQSSGLEEQLSALM